MSYQVLLACKKQLVSLHFPLSHIIHHFPFCIFIFNFIYYLYCYCSYCQASNANASRIFKCLTNQNINSGFSLSAFVIVLLWLCYLLLIKHMNLIKSCQTKEWFLVESYLLSLEWFKYATCFIGMLACDGFDVANIYIYIYKNYICV